jgi:small-conductance mechanosensitive channel
VAAICLVLGLLVLAAVPARAAEADKPQADKAQTAKTLPPAPEQEPPKDWQVILTMHQESLVQQASRFKSMEELLPKNVRRFRSDLSALEGKLDELELIIGLSGGNPWELRAVLNDMARIRRATETLVGPFADGREELQKIATRLDALKEEFTKRLEEQPEPEIAEAVNYSMRYLSGVKASLAGVRSTLDKELAPAKDFQASLGKAEEALRQKLPKAWKSYYFTSSPELFSWKGWLESAKRIESWAKSNATIARSLTRGSDAQRAMSVAVKAAVGLVLLGIFDLVAGRRLRRRFPDLRGLVQLRRAWRLAGLGFILSWVGLDAPLLLHEVLSGLSEILLAAAFAVFSWFLVQASGLVGGGKARNPLRWPWRMFSLGLALQIIDLPEPALTGVWIVLLLLFFQVSRRQAGRDAGPLRLPGRVTPVVAVALVVMAALGWQHLSVLVLAGWFLVLAAMQIGAGLSRLVAEWQSRAAREGTSMLTRGLVSGLGFPLIFLTLFFLVLYWFSTELGGQDLFLEAVALTVTVGDVSVTLGRLALILTGFFLTRSALFVTRSFIRDLPRLRPGIDPGVRDVLDTTSMYLLWGIYALFSLFLLGFSFTSLAVVAGGLSVGIGFGLQNIVNNFVAGLILLFGRSLQAGDTIQIDTVWGRVRKVNIRNTVVQTFDNATLFVPNSDLIAGKLVNWTHRDPTVRREIAVGVAYGSETELVRSILLEAAAGHPRVLRDPAPSVLFQNFGESSLDFKLFFWVDDVSAALTAMSDIRFAIDRRFREEGIDIPFPQREVRIVDGADPAARAAAGGTD